MTFIPFIHVLQKLPQNDVLSFVLRSGVYIQPLEQLYESKSIREQARRSSVLFHVRPELEAELLSVAIG